MTIVIADNSPRKSYTATAGQTAFPTVFAFFDEADINVYINNTLQTLNTNYTVTGGSGSDGTVTLTTGASAGDVIVLTRDVELERTTDFPSSGPFQVGSLNTELDKIIAMIADMKDLAERGLRLADSDTGAALQLEDKNARKGTVLAFNATTGAVEVGPTIADTQSIADIKADIAALADIEDGTVATDAISNLAAIISDVTTAASNISAIQGASGNATTATTKAAEAAASATTASTKASEAATSATTATTKASEAATSATSAATSATTATTKASEASTSATNAATSATSASTAQTAAETAQTAAETAQTAAETAKTGAETAKTAAETAKTGAETAKTAAETAQTAAEAAETNAAASATTSTTKATQASTSATNAATSETNASNSETNAASSATAAQTAKDAALAALDSFDDRYLGVKSSAPTVDNDGNALVAGAIYFDSTDGSMKVYTGSAWVAAYVDGSDYAALVGATFTGNVTMPTVDINGGAIDGTTIGGTTAAAGTFTTLTASGDLTVDTNTLHVDSTDNRVGVNTLSPATELDVAGTTPTLTISDTQNKSWTSADTTLGELAFRTRDTSGIGAHNIAFVRAVNEVTSSSTPSGALSFGISAANNHASETMRIDSSGNVGISQTTGLSAKLNIQTSNLEGIRIYRYGTNANYGGLAFYDDTNTNREARIGWQSNELRLEGTDTISYHTSTTERMRIDSSGDVIVKSGNELKLNRGDNARSMSLYTDNDFGTIETTTDPIKINAKSSRIQFEIDGTEYMRITSSGGLAVGTTSTASRFHVHTGSSAESYMQITNSTTGTTSADGLTIGLNSAEQAIFWQRENNDVRIGTNNTTRMHIDADGSVGIGTVSPDTKLTLAYNINGSSEGLKLTSATRTTTEDSLSAIEVIGNSNYGTVFNVQMDGQIQLSPRGNEALRIDSSGIIGVNTNNPSSIGGSSKLVVNQGADGNGVFVRGGSTRQVQLGTTSTTGYVNADNTSGGLTLNVNGTERMRITSAGDVAIGATSVNSPAAGRRVLEVDGSSSSLIQLGINGSAKGQLYHSGSEFRINSTSTQPMTFYANGSERMRIDSSGRLLVGSTVSNGAGSGTIVAGDASATAGGVALQVRYGADDSVVNYGSQYSSGDALIGHGVASSQTTANTFISTADNAAFARGALIVGDELKFYNASGQTTVKGSTVSMTERLKVSSSGVLTVGSNITLNSRLTFDYNDHYFEAGTNSLSFKNSGGTSYLTITNTALTINGSNQDVKYGVWNNDTYGIGMRSGVTYGYLNDYAMTHCMNNDSDRGFWWGYSGQSKSSGAMSLTTGGKLFVQDSVTVNAYQNSAASPAIRIRNGSTDTSFDTGIYSPDVSLGNAIGFTIDGNEVLQCRRGYGNNWVNPGDDNNTTLGISSKRWKQLYAGTTTISTSDENQKQQIATLTDAEITAATAISKLFRTYKWNDAVEEKGDNARTHTGVIAQQVKQAMTDAGLDATKYAFFCSDTWWTDTVVVDPVEKVAAVYDDDGNMVTEGVDEVVGHTYTVDYFDEDEAPDSATKYTMLGIRYPDLLSFISAATEQRLTNIETRLTALES